MAQLDFALLSVAATEDGETFNLLGAGVEEVRVQNLPAVTLIYLVARWNWDSVDVQTVLTAGVSCRSLETGAVLYENTFDAGVSARRGQSFPARLKTALPLTLETFGEHVVELTVQRRVLKRMKFAVMQGHT